MLTDPSMSRFSRFKSYSAFFQQFSPFPARDIEGSVNTKKMGRKSILALIGFLCLIALLNQSTRKAPKLLVLVMPDKPNEFFRNWWLQIGRAVRPLGIDVYQVVRGPSDVMDSDIIQLQGEANDETVNLTIRALRAVGGYKYDYVVRTHPSAFWNFTALLDFLRDKQIRYGGLLLHYPPRAPFVHGATMILGNPSVDLENVMDLERTEGFIGDVAFGVHFARKKVEIYNLNKHVCSKKQHASCLVYHQCDLQMYNHLFGVVFLKQT